MAVYMIRAGADGPVKIGVAAHPQKRLSALQTGQPETLTILRVLEGDRHFESALHRHFAHRRTRGEWFKHCNEMLGDLEFLRRSAANDLGFADLPIPAPKRTQSVRYDAALVRVFAAAGGPSKVAVYLGLVPSAVTQWSRAPDRHIHRLEALTGIPAREIRPDLWDAPATNTAPSSNLASEAA